MRAKTFLYSVVLLIAPLVAAAQGSSIGNKNVIVRHVAENQTCASNCSTKDIYVTTPHAIGDTLKSGLGARKVDGTPIDTIPAFPRKSTWVGANESDLVVEFNAHFVANLPSYIAAVTTWQTQYGMGTAVHDIIQKVTHRGKQKRVMINLISFDNGNYYYNGARVTPEDATTPSTILYARAIPSAPAPGIPPAWNWPGGGTLSHETRDENFTNGGGFTNIAVGAAYNEPFNFSGVPVDPDQLLKCLMDKSRPGCGQPQPDVKSLIGQVDATYAVVDYYRLVKPVGQPYAGGYSSIMTINVTDRLVTFPCASVNDGTYSQNFRYTQRLEYVIDRYITYPDGRHYFVQRFRDEVQSPEAVVPGTAAINRLVEFPLLSTRFLHSKTNAYTNSTPYAPNAVNLGPVTVVDPASCGCVAQPDFNENLQCSIINATWSGTFLRQNIWNSGLCAYQQVDNTGTCITCGCPADATGNPPCVKDSTLSCPATFVGSRFFRQDFNFGTCGWGAQYLLSNTCTCPVGTVEDSGACVPATCPPGQSLQGGVCVNDTDLLNAVTIACDASATVTSGPAGNFGSPWSAGDTCGQDVTVQGGSSGTGFVTSVSTLSNLPTLATVTWIAGVPITSTSASGTVCNFNWTASGGGCGGAVTGQCADVRVGIASRVLCTTVVSNLFN